MFFIPESDHLLRYVDQNRPLHSHSKNIDADTMCGFVLGQISRVIFIKPTLALQRMPLVKIIFDREKTLVEGQKSKKDLARNH